MDIEILLLLQNFREGAGSFLIPLMETATNFILGSGPTLIMCLMYWCIDKQTGSLVMLTTGFGTLINGFLKCIFCVSRPWLRDARVQPYGNSKAGAGGYSFPSGHAQIGMALFGPIAVWSWRKKLKVLSVILWICGALIGFSRMFLGVHTPQDVLVGIGVTLILIYFIGKLPEYVDGKEGRDWKFLLISLAIVIAITVFGMVKSYPVEYDANGQVVDRVTEIKGSILYGDGMIVGALLGWFCERKVLKFENAKNMKQRALRLVLGLALWLLVSKGVNPLLMGLLYRPLGGIGAYSFTYGLNIFTIAFLCPLLFTAVEKKLKW